MPVSARRKKGTGRDLLAGCAIMRASSLIQRGESTFTFEAGGIYRLADLLFHLQLFIYC